MSKSTRIVFKQFTEVTVNQSDLEEVGTLETEPYFVLTRKIESLSQLLGCTEREAERMILEML